MAGSDVALNVEGLSVSFGKDRAVKGVSFKVHKGKTLAIAGESGSGKSLTALALMGLLPKAAVLHARTMQLHTSSSTISLATDDLQRVRGLDISMVFQEPMSSLNPVMSVGKQLKEAIQIHQNITTAEAKQQAVEWLARVQLPNPELIYKRYPHQLSGGQKQRVMIAMAMCNHPAVLIADEPTTALDVTVQQEIVGLMAHLQEQHGTAMLFITHDLALAATIADDVMVMYGGEIVEYGAADEVLHHPQQSYTRALIACKPSPEKKGHRLPIVADYIAGTHMEPPAPSEPERGRPESKDVLLNVSDLKVWFPQNKNLFGTAKEYTHAVDEVSFVLHRGEVLGLVGESGCGKSTLARCLMGLVPVTAGAIIFEGSNIAQLPARDWKKLRPQIQMIFQDPYSSLNPRMTVGDMIREPLMVHNIVSPAEVEKEVKRLLDMVQLPADAVHRYPHQFSGGQRQRIGIARALALRPRLLICDESVSALDVSIQAQVLNLLKELQTELGLTYLFISHDLAVVHYISDLVMVMHNGKIVETGEAGEVLRHPRMEYTKRLVAAMP